MTIDERLDKLIERHETMQKDNDKRVAQLMEAITSLSRIVDAHERRLDEMEGR
jgi:hypothetical protein